MIQAESGPEPPFYPEEDDVAETLLHLLIRMQLLDLVRRWLANRAERALVGSDQFLYWVPGNPHRAVAPDLYVLPGLEPDLLVRSVKLWEVGVAPSLVVEVVSDDVGKDYVEGPMRYAELGATELVVHDPEPERGADRVRWQVYRRRGSELMLEERTDGDRVRSEVLGCWLRVVRDTGGRPLVRLATDPAGDTLVPTVEEALQAELAALRAELGRIKRP